MAVMTQQDKRGPAAEPLPAARRHKGMDTPLLFMILLLMAVGLLALYTASYVYSFWYNGGRGMLYLTQQATFAAVGIFAMLVISRINYHFYGFFHQYFFGAVLVLMYLTPFIGKTVKGAKRWIGVGETFRPS